MNQSTSPPRLPKVAPETLVGFRLGDARCAVPISHVREILRPGKLTIVPAADPSVVGVADIRGEILLVLDPTKIVGLEGGVQGPIQRRRWLVLRVGDHHVAWVVDGVSAVFSSSREQAVEGTLPVAFNAWLAWVAKHENELVFVFDVKALASSFAKARASIAPGGI